MRDRALDLVRKETKETKGQVSSRKPKGHQFEQLLPGAEATAARARERERRGCSASIEFVSFFWASLRANGGAAKRTGSSLGCECTHISFGFSRKSYLNPPPTPVWNMVVHFWVRPSTFCDAPTGLDVNSAAERTWLWAIQELHLTRAPAEG